MYGFHFVHHKAQVQDLSLNYIRCSIIIMEMRNQALLLRWTRRLLVILEKSPYTILILILWHILVLKEYFNTLRDVVLKLAY